MNLSSKYRDTAQRKLIYSLVEQAKDHPSAMDIYGMARLENPKISIGTVYRSLGLMDDQGLIRSLTVDGVKRFDGEIQDHWHFLCRECKKIYDLRMPELQEILNDLMKNMYRVEELRLEMKGICHECIAKQTANDQT